MSGKRDSSQAKDRRSERTRQALLEAFVSLLFQRKYSQIRVSDIIDHAKVARSTFYDHFTSKDDILTHSMASMYATLADVVTKNANLEATKDLLDHLWENRSLARQLMDGPSAALGPKRGAHQLAQEIEKRLKIHFGQTEREPLVPLSLAATLVAAGIMAVLRDWLTGKAACTSAALAKALHAGTLAGTGAFIYAR